MTIGEEEDVARKRFWGRGRGSYVELPGVMQGKSTFGQERVHTPTRKVLAVQLLSSMAIKFRARTITNVEAVVVWQQMNVNAPRLPHLLIGISSVQMAA